MPDRNDLAPRDTRPESVAWSDRINTSIRVAAGRGAGPRLPLATPWLTDAVALVEDGAPRRAVSLALRGDAPDPTAVQFAKDVLDQLGVTALDEPGYAPVAAVLSVSANPGPAVRDAAALALLTLDGPGDAATAGALLDADGAGLERLVNRIRARAGLQPLAWMDGETPLTFDAA